MSKTDFFADPNGRRQFLKKMLLGSVAGSSSILLDSLLNSANAAISPAADDFKTLVIVNLNGGNDSLNMLIPATAAEYNLYQSPRENLAFSRSSLLTISPDGMEANSFGLNPGMPELRNMFEQGEASFVANVGGLVEPITKQEFLDPDRTKKIPEGLGGHNTQSAYWQADHSNQLNTTKDGWGGRLGSLFESTGVLPINLSVASNNPVFNRHQLAPYYSLGINGLISLRDYRVNSLTPGILARRSAIDALNELAISSSDPFLKHAGTLFRDGLDLNMSLQTALSGLPDLSDQFPAPQIGTGSALASKFALAAEMILIRQTLGMRRQIIFLESAGFDTHSKQGENHANLMADLSAYLNAFNTIMKDNNVHDSVVTITTSEFGRNLASNGDGTDHAWGAQHIVMGGPVDGGKIFGTFPSLELDGPDDYNGLGRMIPTISVSQYAATAARWFGVPDDDLIRVFPNLIHFGDNPYLEYLA